MAKGKKKLQPVHKNRQNSEIEQLQLGKALEQAIKRSRSFPADVRC